MHTVLLAPSLTPAFRLNATTLPHQCPRRSDFLKTWRRYSTRAGPTSPSPRYEAARKLEKARRALTAGEVLRSNSGVGAVVSRARRLDEERVDEDLDEFVHLKTRPNHVLVLLDGDGYAFRPSLVFEGRKGGVKAAELLAHSVVEDPRVPYGLPHVRVPHLQQGGDLRSTFQWVESQRAPPRRRAARFLEDFWQGFQEPLSNFVVDSGRGKESADHKLKELYRNHIRSPETLKIILGVANDNGYAPLLRSEVIPLFRNRLILLDWHGPFTRDIATLGLPSMHIPDLFFPSLSEWEREREAEREAEEEVVKEREEEAKKEKEKEAENAGRREDEG
ncbi:hypothetical protein DFP72DRAFT_284327 [Ephemerocybe angulata]|uniref:DUF7923 domain-containing protein n=1 Tax=Ephemerocybe angulata TaxID=980116 RepID=A0A8H6I1U0_9AGAR|nr:hypothetical protein DFP72DRAFT_284327 [Tulosesus angulatus]